MRSLRLAAALAVVSDFLLVVRATPYAAAYSSCISNFNAAAPGDRMNLSAVYANLVDGGQAKQLGLIGDGTDVLRVDLIGTAGSEIVGYANDTNKLGASAIRQTGLS
jgi:hypothetical protein